MVGAFWSHQALTVEQAYWVVLFGFNCEVTASQTLRLSLPLKITEFLFFLIFKNVLTECHTSNPRTSSRPLRGYRVSKKQSSPPQIFDSFIYTSIIFRCLHSTCLFHWNPFSIRSLLSCHLFVWLWCVYWSCLHGYGIRDYLLEHGQFTSNCTTAENDSLT